ncbi:MAG TPA: large conductance mechanosensitive channel protein MscL, partial [Fimbriimonas sp.]|nr:large conductance mechanosensitive channel protein MscL [Fimbriimonas sp.]
EFKEFINKGNLIDFAVGVVMGAAFTTVTGAFMEKIVNPLLGSLVKVDFGSYGVNLGQDKDGKDIVLAYGGFLSTVLNFIITAFVMFLVVKAYNKAKAKAAAEAAPPAPAGPTDVELLTEIRDLLKK